MDKFTQNKEQIIQYLKDGCKSIDTPLCFGVELEHFIVDASTKEAVSYYGDCGVEVILEKLTPYYEQKVYSEGHLIALGRVDIALSLEPAAQLEVSISPKQDIEEIYAVYEQFVQEITPILEDFGYELVTTGYQPKSKVNDLELLPKTRYRFMDAYFEKIGCFGRQMMRGTAATQVSIDYYSEEDFKKKYKAAYRLRDVLGYFCSNSPCYEGKAYNGHNLRNEIWAKTDSRRVDVSPFLTDETMNFEGYADFVMQTPVIVNKEGETEHYDERTIGEIAKERIFSKEETTHVLSMVFPMIRAKQFLELRYADSMPIDRVLSYVLVLKGLFTDIEFTLAWAFSQRYDKMKLQDKTDYMLNQIKSKLSEEEIRYLERKKL